MADFLIITQPRNAGFRRGDIVAVDFDDAPRGKDESLNTGFVLYKQPGISVGAFLTLQPDAETGMPFLDEALLPPDLLAIGESTGILQGTKEGLSIFLGALKWR
ncbi:MAG: hypothetical protein Kow00104_02490 [Rhodothalassiaceae bacterium]